MGLAHIRDRVLEVVLEEIAGAADPIIINIRVNPNGLRTVGDGSVDSFFLTRAMLRMR